MAERLPAQDAGTVYRRNGEHVHRRCGAPLGLLGENSFGEAQWYCFSCRESVFITDGMAPYIPEYGGGVARGQMTSYHGAEA